MTEETPIRGLQKPTDGDDSALWFELLELLYDTLDTDLVYRGSSRPDPVEDNVLFVNISNGAIEYYNEGWTTLWAASSNYARTDEATRFTQSVFFDSGLNLENVPITGVSYITAGRDDAGFNTSGSGAGEFSIYDSDAEQYIARFLEGGNVDVPNGELHEQGDRVATRAFSNTTYASAGHNHDASYAAIDHNHDSAYASATHSHEKVDIPNVTAYTDEANNFDILPTVNGTRLATEGYADSAYLDSDARNAVESGPVDSITFGNIEHTSLNGPALGWDNSDSWVYRDHNQNDRWLLWTGEESLEVQIDGADGQGIINFKTQ